MGYGLNISKLADQLAKEIIPQGKTGHYARYDEQTTRALSAALNITLREVVSSRAELGRLLRLADHPSDEVRAESFQNLDEYDQHQVLHRLKTG